MSNSPKPHVLVFIKAEKTITSVAPLIPRKLSTFDQIAVRITNVAFVRDCPNVGGNPN